MYQHAERSSLCSEKVTIWCKEEWCLYEVGANRLTSDMAIELFIRWEELSFIIKLDMIQTYDDL